MLEEQRVVGKTWLRWKTVWDRKRRERWEASMGAKEREVVGWIDERLKVEFFSVRFAVY
jgi:hypothetical protein